MKLRRFLGGLFLLLFTSTTLISAQEEHLVSQDVTRVMDQIFKQHVDQRHMSETIIRQSFRVYIDQFDPDRIYLLQSEVNPFLNLTDEQVRLVMDQYRQNDLSMYQKLNTQIQKAISRAQQIRSQIEEEGLGSIESVSPPPSGGQLAFPKTLRELKTRQRDHIARFIQNEGRRYGDAYVRNNLTKLLAFYEKKQRQIENQYLPVGPGGTLITAEQKEHQFYIHVLKSLAASLDSHTTVLDDDEAFDMRVRLRKGFEGIGVTLVERADGIFVTKLLKDGPAERSGKIRVGDQILKIDNVEVKNLDFDAIEDQMRGDEGSSISLLLQRGDRSSPFHVTLRRETIVINEGRVKVAYESFGNGIIGKIRLDSFYSGTSGISSVNDVKRAIEELDSKGNLRGLILDLRENTGGFLSQAIKVAGLFITNGVIVISKYHNGEERYYRDMDTSVAYDGPLVILTSKATASAAEIVAQALQDYGVAVIVGDEQTYGKGTIQSQTVTKEDKSSSYFKVTVGKYYTVSGKTPQLHGVKADIVVPGRFSQIEIGEEYLDYPSAGDKREMIASAYHDRLEDIRPTLKSWYMRYYMPTLQEPRTEWKSVLPQLRKNSKYRIKRNKNYQVFLKKIRGEEIEENENGEADEYGRYSKSNYGREDLQMQEAVNVVKDMIYLQPKAEKQAANN